MTKRSSAADAGQDRSLAAAAGPAVRPAPFFALALVLALAFGAVGALVLAGRHLPWPGLGPDAAAAARTVHGHAMVFGFTALFVMGVAYHALPRLSGAALAAPGLARASLWLATGGVGLGALAALAGPWRNALALAAAGALIAGAAAFVRVVRPAVALLPSGTPAAPWLRAGPWWLVIAAGLDVGAVTGRVAAPAVWDAALHGFAATWIFGMSMQFLPVLLGRPVAPLGRRLFVAYQLAVAAVVLATTLLPPLHPFRAVAAAGLAAATVAVVAALRPFAGPRPTGDGGAARFLRTAWAWLLASILCGPGWRAASALAGGAAPVLAEDFARHAFTLGFLTQMIVGVTSRLVPAFAGRPLWNGRAAGAVYGLLNAGVAIRGIQVLVEAGGPWSLWPWVAASGPLALAALALFTAAVVRAARPASA